jgi:plasmid maintenance system antidote protein VapI
MLVERLQRELANRCRRNPHYSLRAFARHLEMDSSTLSAILRRKRPITQKSSQKLTIALGVQFPEPLSR